MNKTAMTPGERLRRARLAKLVSMSELVRGSLTIRDQVCGKSNCRCSRGEKHASMYLTYSKAGEFKQIYIPQRLQQKVQQWVDEYKESRQLLEEISEICLERLAEKKGEGS